MDILVFTPVLRLEPETVTAIFSLEHDGPLSILLQRDNPNPSPDLSPSGERRQGILNHLHQYQRARELFLKGPYEAMLVIESDIIPPKETLTWLEALEADVAYGCYLFQKYPSLNVYERYPADVWGMPANNTGEPLNAHPLVWRDAKRARIVDCSGAGLGCILIRRKVLEAIDFRLEEESSVHCDHWWTEDVYHAGFSQRADLRVVCGHKKPDGEILWPDLS